MKHLNVNAEFGPKFAAPKNLLIKAPAYLGYTYDKSASLANSCLSNFLQKQKMMQINI